MTTETKIFIDRIAHLGRLDHEADAKMPAERTTVVELAKMVGPVRTEAMERMPRHLQAYVKG